MEAMVFIYAKDGKIKALNLSDAEAQHKMLIDDGYIHTSTLNTCMWIEYLHNKSKSKIKDIKSLSELK